MKERSRAAVLGYLSVGVLLATAPWLAGGAVAPSLSVEWGLSSGESAWLTTCTQLGFIAGTLIYAIGNLADRYSARWVFVLSALLSAALNLGFAYASHGLISASVFRFGTGICLAGVYPVGMKIVASWFGKGLGMSLSVMLAALTLGSSLPFLARAAGTDWPWQETVALASAAATLGALVVALLVRDGPRLPSRAAFDASMALKVFKVREFRLAALGYFGHMWELYAFWALCSAYLASAMAGKHTPLAYPMVAFLAIASGALGCILGGLLSRTLGPARVALAALVISGGCCLLSGFAFELTSPLLIAFVILWGMAVVADSPQFSALSAKTCPPNYVGTALTIQNGIGFAITIGSIQLLPVGAKYLEWQWAFLLLAPGPLLGSLATYRLQRLGVRST